MDSNKVSNQQIIAKKYIEEHDLERTVSEMLNSLVHEKSKQPIVYMIKYLAGLLTEDELRQHGLVIPEPYPKGKPIIKFPNMEKSNSILKNHLTKPLWTAVKYNKTKFGGNIMNIVKLAENNVNDKIGCVITDSDALSAFAALLQPIILEIHKMPLELSNHEYNSNFSLANFSNFPHNDEVITKISYVSFSFSRNLQDYPFTPLLTSEKRSHIENIITKAINALITDQSIKNGKFYHLKDNENEVRNILREVNIDEIWLKNAELKQGNIKLLTFRMA
jgi:hypothetical protein